MAPRHDLTREQAIAQLRYDPETGQLFRKPIPENTRLDRMRNTRFANKPATYRNSTSHIQLQINGHSYLAHRVIWLMVYGEWPSGDIDHVNGERTDNRLCNLRLATASQNACNSKMRANNTTGYRGVVYHRRRGRWSALIAHERIKHHLGYFPSAQGAALAYDAAAKKYHGEFATLNFGEA